jgi:hypothetical protein
MNRSSKIALILFALVLAAYAAANVFLFLRPAAVTDEKTPAVPAETRPAG